MLRKAVFALCDIVAEPSTFSEINISFINVADAVLVGAAKQRYLCYLTSGKLVALLAQVYRACCVYFTTHSIIDNFRYLSCGSPAYGKTRY